MNVQFASVQVSIVEFRANIAPEKESLTDVAWSIAVSRRGILTSSPFSRLFAWSVLFPMASFSVSFRRCQCRQTIIPPRNNDSALIVSPLTIEIVTGT